MAAASDMRSNMVPLKETNYATWKVQCRMALMREGLWSIVNKEEVMPELDNNRRRESEEARRKFKARYEKALTTIVLAVSPSLLYLLGDPEDPVKVWDTLENQFQKKSWANKLILKTRLSRMRLKDNQSVSEHIRGMTEIFQELSIIGQPMEEEDRVVQLLTSLPKKYNVLVTSLLSNVEVPSMEIVTERIMHEDRKLKEIESKESKNQNQVFYAGNGGGRREPPTCFHCGFKGHIKRNCEQFKKDQEKQEKQGKQSGMKSRGGKFKGNNANLSISKQQDTDEESSDSESGFCCTHQIGEHALATVTEEERKKWLVDSGASKPMCNDEKQFDTLKKLERPERIKVGDGFYLTATMGGNIKLKLEVNGEIKTCTLRDALYVPELSYNLLSVSKATDSGKQVIFEGNKCEIKNRREEILLQGSKHRGLYYVNTAKEDKTSQFANCAESSEQVSQERVWHSRYGHLGDQSLTKLVKDDMVSGLNYKKSFSKDEIGFCEPCAEGKQQHTKFPRDESNRAENKLDLVHTDVCGKMDEPSLSKKEYFVSFIDDKTRFAWTYPIRKKSDTFETFLRWKAKAERSSERKLKTLRSDNGGEYISNEFEEYLEQEGIHHQNTIPKTPQQNGVAERMNRTLEESIRSMLSESKMPKQFWAEALSTATYLRNLSPTKAVKDITPYEAWSSIKPDVQHLRVFGSICYAHIHKTERQKLDPKSRKAMLLGYGDKVKGYRLYDLKDKKVFHSRDVLFKEMTFKENKKATLERIEESDEETEVTNDEEIVLTEMTNINQDPEDAQDETNEEREDNTVRRSNRIRKGPEYYGEWVNVVSISEEPKTVNEALSGINSQKWTEAMQSEMKSLNENKVWELVKLPKGRKAIGCKWIFKTKIDGDGNIERYKARLVAQGYTQKYGVDYDQTFSPVVSFESIRSIAAIAAQKGLKLHQMDVKTAFLNGELTEEIYLKQPEGFIEKGYEDYVCKLKRSIYGLKQSARCWNVELDKKLKDMGFTQCKSDPCIYTKSAKEGYCIIAVYVDDLIIGGESEKDVKLTKKTISEKFEVTDMGLLHYFLGVKVIQKFDKGEIWIGQPSFTKELLKKLQMAECKQVETPSDPSMKLTKRNDNEDEFDKVKYQSAVGSLLYLSTRSRPDIAFAVGNAARYCANPSQSHWSAVKRILRYLKGTTDLGLLYEGDEKNLEGYSDADWAGDINDRKSTSGYVFIMSGSAVSWRSKKQTSVALSTAEAEYIALSSATQEAMWLRQLLSDLVKDYQLSVPTTIYEDNQSAICMTRNNQSHGRSKHVDIKYHFVREQVERETIKAIYCKSEEMTADILTKGLLNYQFKKLRTKLGMSPIIQEK